MIFPDCLGWPASSVSSYFLGLSLGDKCKEAGHDRKIALSRLRAWCGALPTASYSRTGHIVHIFEYFLGARHHVPHSICVVRFTPSDSWIWRFLLLKPELLIPAPVSALPAFLPVPRWWPPPGLAEQIPWPRHPLLPGWLLPWAKPTSSLTCIVAFVSPRASWLPPSPTAASSPVACDAAHGKGVVSQPSAGPPLLQPRPLPF